MKDNDREFQELKAFWVRKEAENKNGWIGQILGIIFALLFVGVFIIGSWTMISGC